MVAMEFAGFLGRYKKNVTKLGKTLRKSIAERVNQSCLLFYATCTHQYWQTFSPVHTGSRQHNCMVEKS